MENPCPAYYRFAHDAALHRYTQALIPIPTPSKNCQMFGVPPIAVYARPNTTGTNEAHG
jgi:hypothetical protein